ncbi:hypothetical protein HK28_06000 [Acetobacter sp. DsW_063]|nr:hypothetical protein HK28_06000 [Acetobacter sp. DsW_063]
MTPGDIIRAARKKAGLSQRALAQKLGLSAGAVAQWETDTTTPTNDNWMALRSLIEIPKQIEPSGAIPYGGELVEDADELALLRFWRSLDDVKRRVVLELLHIDKITST